MSDHSGQLSVTYSDLPYMASRKITYSDGKEEEMDLAGSLETLSLLYDRVWLPFPFGFDPSGPSIWDVARDAIPESQVYPYYRECLPLLSAEHEKFMTRWEPMFQEGIVRFLPPPIQNLGQEYPQYVEVFRTNFDSPDNVTKPLWFVMSGTFALAMHSLFAKKPAPEIFVSNPRDTNTHRLTSYLIFSIFKIRIPKLQSIPPEQILEIRQAIRDTRQGFVDYMCEMVDDMEKRLSSGETTELEAATKTVERKIIPRYEEYLRQIKALDASSGSKILEPVGKLLEIDASPATPKFWGSILAAVFGSTKAAADEIMKAQENSRQAFQLLAKVESAARG